MAGPYLLLDIGGTDIKSAWSDSSGRIQEIFRLPTPPFLELAGPSRIIEQTALTEACKTALTAHAERHATWSGIFVSSQMAGYSLLDTSGGVVGEIVSWQDLRGSALLGSLDEPDRWLPRELIQSLGAELKPHLPLFNIRARAISGELAGSDGFDFVTLAMAALRPLLSSFADICHVTDAAASGMYMPERNAWVADPLSVFGCPINFPKVSHSVREIGRLSFFDGPPVFTAVGDQQASLLGAGIEPGTIVVNIGTGGQVASLIPQSKRDEAVKCGLQVRPFLSDDFVIATITHLPAGRALGVLLDGSSKFNGQNSFQRFLDLCHTNVYGEALDLDLLSRGELDERATNSNSLDYLAASFVSSMTVRYFAAIERLLNFEDSQKLVFAGGLGQKFSALHSRLGKVTDLPTHVAQTDESTLSGLAILASSVQR